MPGPSDINNIISNTSGMNVVKRTSERDKNLIGLYGDWNGSGKLEHGLFDKIRNKFFIFSNGNKSSFTFGNRYKYFTPLVGDWNGNGEDTIGIYEDSCSEGD